MQLDRVCTGRLPAGHKCCTPGWHAVACSWTEAPAVTPRARSGLLLLACNACASRCRVLMP
eukprot:550209-Pelagomonas_calceolata.AAC.1